MHDETLILPIHEHIQIHASQYKKKTQHPFHPYTNLKHTLTLQGEKKPTIFNNGRYATAIPTSPNTVTTTYIQTDMRHIHASIVSRHLATRGNITILPTPLPHITSSQEILSRLTRRILAPLRTNKSPSNVTYTKRCIHYHYAPYVTLTHTTHIISSTASTYAPH